MPSQWETPLLCNDVSHWLGANLESALLRAFSLISSCPSSYVETSNTIFFLVALHTWSSTRQLMWTVWLTRDTMWSRNVNIASCSSLTHPTSNMCFASVVSTCLSHRFECRYNTVQYCEMTRTRQNVGSTKDAPYFTLAGELWDVFCGYLWENWPCYNVTALYFIYN